jgi:hypothetical protein
MLSLDWRTDLELRHALHPAVGYHLIQDTADFREALAELGLADIFNAERLEHWSNKYPLAAVVETMTELLSTNASMDDWEWALWFDTWFSDNEKTHLSECIIDWLCASLEHALEENLWLEEKLSHARNYQIGMTGLAIAFLFSSVFDGKNDPLSDTFPPAQLQTLTPEQIDILRKQTEFFLKQNQQINWLVAE